MKRKHFLFLCTVIFLFTNSISYARTIYIDNEGGDDNNGGTSWNDAYKSIDWILMYAASGDPAIEDNYYIKATNTPYRKGNITVPFFPFLIIGAGNFYFDATGNPENPAERGEARAIIYGSKQVPAGGWIALSPPSNTEKYYYAESPLGGDTVAALYIDGETPQKIERVDSLLNMGNNKYYYFPDTHLVYYRNDTTNPSNLPIEWVSGRTVGIEGSEYMKLYGVKLRYFNHGYSHGACAVEEIANMDVGYSGDTGVIINSKFIEGGIFRNITSHHNGKDGVHIKGNNNTKVFNTVSYENTGDGFVLFPNGGDCSVSATMAYTSNNTSSNNDGAGFRIISVLTDPGTGVDMCTSWIMVNSISSNNLSGEFILEDAHTAGYFYSNGWNGSANNQLFTDNSGGNNLENIDPMFVDSNSGDFHLLPGSPYIDSGINFGLAVDDFDGELRDVLYPDIGADEYVAP